MKDDATNLDRMHDIILPEPVSWWPPAPGWSVVLAVLLLVALSLAVRAWREWRQNAYRREALEKLEKAASVLAISELLRRTALAIAPRPVVAAQVGAAWPLWLEETAPVPITQTVRKQLSLGPYEPLDQSVDVRELKQFASLWIKRHHDYVEPSETASASPPRQQKHHV